MESTTSNRYKWKCISNQICSNRKRCSPRHNRLTNCRKVRGLLRICLPSLHVQTYWFTLNEHNHFSKLQLTISQFQSTISILYLKMQMNERKSIQFMVSRTVAILYRLETPIVSKIICRWEFYQCSWSTRWHWTRL